MTDNKELIKDLRSDIPETHPSEAADALESADKRIAELEAALKMAREALMVGQVYCEQAMSGYGFYRPSNPHRFCPDFESCTPEEIANHSAACEAYDKGSYVDNHKDGWISESLHVTEAPWGVGTYTDSDPIIDDALTRINEVIGCE